MKKILTLAFLCIFVIFWMPGFNLWAQESGVEIQEIEFQKEIHKGPKDRPTTIIIFNFKKHGPGENWSAYWFAQTVLYQGKEGMIQVEDPKYLTEEQKQSMHIVRLIHRLQPGEYIFAEFSSPASPLLKKSFPGVFRREYRLWDTNMDGIVDEARISLFDDKGNYLEGYKNKEMVIAGEETHLFLAILQLFYYPEIEKEFQEWLKSLIK